MISISKGVQMLNRTQISLFFTFLISTCFAQTPTPSSTPQEKAQESEFNFDSIKKVLKEDMLDGEAEKKAKKIQALAAKKAAFENSKYYVPNKDDFYSFLSEYWLVKNATILKWDFQKPDYGLEASFKEFLEKLGHYNKKFKILILDSANVFHFALPSNPDEYIFLISLPFMRSLDLSKLEISIVLYEDFKRIEKGEFKKFLETEELKKWLGSNFQKTKLNKELMTNLLKKMDEFIFDKGYSFQTQFEVTNVVGQTLKNEMTLWNTYYKLKQKIDDLAKSNLLYKKYNSLYPSTELQLNWLKPKS
jgi:hypothetical protein